MAGQQFREYVISNKLLTSVIDLKHYQVFDKFTTFTAILKLDKNNNDTKANYFILDKDNKKKSHRYIKLW